MSKEARQRFLAFARSSDAAWTANFRDLNNAVVRMATLAPGGRITVDVVDDEIGRLREKWWTVERSDDDLVLEEVLGADRAAGFDRFDRVQLADVIRVCRESRTLSEAGRALFAVSRGKRKVVNDADRLRKYLARFDLDWVGVVELGGR